MKKEVFEDGKLNYRATTKMVTYHRWHVSIKKYRSHELLALQNIISMGEQERSAGRVLELSAAKLCCEKVLFDKFK